MEMEETYGFAKAFLLGKIPSPHPEAILTPYLELPDGSQKPVDLPELYRRLLSSAQNTGMMPQVIGGAVGGVRNLSSVTFGFDPRKTVGRYGTDHLALLDTIIRELKPGGKIRREGRSMWPKYCRTMLSAASFFEQFDDGPAFYEWANGLYADKRSMAALPMILDAEVDGVGYALACDFLKELGFIQFGKPDVHVNRIFIGIGICKPGARPYHVQKAIAEMASQSKVSPYNVDKLFFLIGSGRLYKHKDLGKNGRIGRMGDEFIDEFRKARA